MALFLFLCEDGMMRKVTGTRECSKLSLNRRLARQDKGDRGWAALTQSFGCLLWRLPSTYVVRTGVASFDASCVWTVRCRYLNRQKVDCLREGYPPWPNVPEITPATRTPRLCKGRKGGYHTTRATVPTIDRATRGQVA